MLSFAALSETAIAESSTTLDASAFMAGAAATVSVGTVDYEAKANLNPFEAAFQVIATVTANTLADVDAQASITLDAATATTAVNFGQINLTATPTAVTATFTADAITSKGEANVIPPVATTTTTAGTLDYDAKANITLDAATADADLTANDFADEDAQGTATISGVSATGAANWDTVNGIYAVQVVYLATDFERKRCVNIVPYGNYKVYVTR